MSKFGRVTNYGRNGIWKTENKKRVKSSQNEKRTAAASTAVVVAAAKNKIKKGRRGGRGKLNCKIKRRNMF